MICIKTQSWISKILKDKANIQEEYCHDGTETSYPGLIDDLPSLLQSILV